MSQSVEERFNLLSIVGSALREDCQSCALVRRQIHNPLNCLIQTNTVPHYMVGPEPLNLDLFAPIHVLHACCLREGDTVAARTIALRASRA